MSFFRKKWLKSCKKNDKIVPIYNLYSKTLEKRWAHKSEERELNDELMKEIKQLGFSTNRDKWRCLLA